MTLLKHFFSKNEEEIKNIIENKEIIILKGWINTFRKQTPICFFTINDGSTSSNIQVLFDYSINTDNKELLDKIEKLNNGCYIKFSGIVVISPAKGQKYEIQLKDIFDIGECDAFIYPIKKNNKLENLREYAHLRCRTKTLSSVMRIRNTILFETHNFFQFNNFLNLDPNIITTNECEGGAGVFTVTELMDKNIKDIPSKNNIIQYKKDHFKKQAFLTVSSQLQLEAMACSMGNVYTLNKSFRSEHSLTKKHVSEFTHLEIEMIDINNHELMDIGAEYIKYIIDKVFEKNKEDIQQISNFSSKGLEDKYNNDFKNLNFIKVSYNDCIDLLQKEKQNISSEFNINYGDDLSSEAEDYLTKYYKSAVFVYNWPYEIKSFYMKQNNDANKTCSNFDLLMPFGIGELIGGSMREENYDLLKSGMESKNVNINGLEWYLDLRKYGTVKHGGFGLGIDRLIMMLTGMKSIKDVIPFPVYYQNLNF